MDDECCCEVNICYIWFIFSGVAAEKSLTLVIYIILINAWSCSNESADQSFNPQAKLKPSEYCDFFSTVISKTED